MTRHTVHVEVRGPWALPISKRFWENFAPSALAQGADVDVLRTVFRVDADWAVARATVTQHGSSTSVQVEGDGDLDAAAAQVGRFLAIDIDATDWPKVGERDAVVADAQQQLPGLRPCGFHSPYEAAAWSVLSQRVRIVQAATLRTRLVAEHGDDGAFPSPQRLRRAQLDLPGRKAEYLQAVADAALAGQLDGATLHEAEPDRSIADLQAIKGIGPFAAELIVMRGANAPDALARHEHRLLAEVAERYGDDREFAEIAQAWRPFRTWASVYLRALREQRTHEIGRESRTS